MGLARGILSPLRLPVSPRPQHVQRRNIRPTRSIGGLEDETRPRAPDTPDARPSFHPFALPSTPVGRTSSPPRRYRSPSGKSIIFSAPTPPESMTAASKMRHYLV